MKNDTSTHLKSATCKTNLQQFPNSFLLLISLLAVLGHLPDSVPNRFDIAMSVLAFRILEFSSATVHDKPPLIKFWYDVCCW